MKAKITFFVCLALGFTLSALTGKLPADRAAQAQGNNSGTLIISTIAGGGYTGGAPLKQAPMGLPKAVALDPRGRGFYTVEEINQVTHIRFANTTEAPVTLAGITVQPRGVSTVIGAEVRHSDARHAAAPWARYSNDAVHGLAVDPSGEAIFYSDDSERSGGGIFVLNVGEREFATHGQTIPAGWRSKVLTSGRAVGEDINLAEGAAQIRALAMHPGTRDLYYTGVDTATNVRAVYRFESNGAHERFAGGGTKSDEGIPATQASFLAIAGLALDTQGNLWIADAGTGRTPGKLRKVDAGGNITTAVANLPAPLSVAVAADGSVYAALVDTQQIIRLRTGGFDVIAGVARVTCQLNNSRECGDGGAATNATFNLPARDSGKTLMLAADASGVYLPDTGARRVRFINPSASAVTVANITINSQNIETVCGTLLTAPYDGNPAAAAELKRPGGLAADAQDNLFIADSEQGKLRFVNRGEAPVTLFAGTPSEQTAQPGQIVTLNPQAGVRDSGLNGQILTAKLEFPAGLALTSQGLFIVDGGAGLLVRPPGSVSGKRSGVVYFLNTSASPVVLFPQGPVARVEVLPGQIKKIAGRAANQPVAGIGIGDNGPANEAIVFPSDVAMDSRGNLFIADWWNRRIRMVEPQLGVITSLPVVTGYATGIALDAQGRVFIADTMNNQVLRQETPNGSIFTPLNRTSGMQPRDVLVDNDGSLLVTNSDTGQIVRISETAGVLRVSNIAGLGERGYSGDGGPANEARLDFYRVNTSGAPDQPAFADQFLTPAPILRLSNGDLVFTDNNNHRIRLLSAQGSQVLAEVTNQTMQEDEMLTVNFAALDPGAGAITFSVENKPSFGVLSEPGNNTASLRLTPGPNDAGRYQITVKGTQQGRTGSRTFTLDVADVQHPPVIATVIGDRAVENGKVLEIPLEATDPDGDGVLFSLLNAPGFVTLVNKSSRRATLRIAPNLSGALPQIFDGVTVEATDMTENPITVSSRFQVQVVAAIVTGTPRAVVNLSAANYTGGTLACESIVTAFGVELSKTTQVAMTSPLPTRLDGTTVKVKDSAGVERLAALFFVSPTQINYQMPPGTASGAATVTITNADGAVAMETLQIAPVAPGFFTADASGRGLAAAVLLRVKADGAQQYEPISRFDAAQNRMVAVPIDLGAATDQLYLILYGTGVRFRSGLSAVTARVGGLDSPVEFAGALDGFVGLDQLNARLPRGLAGRGEVELLLTVDGKPANPVRLSIQ